MARYDFRSLSDREFEHLVIDLLSAEYSERISRFKPGKDSGVDGRWFTSGNRECVIQCKHWVGTGIKALLREFKKEALKAAILKPARYILVTSVPLSRANKASIRKCFKPWILNDDDVLGPDDLNQLLTKHAEVEKRHYKLWLSGTEVLVRVMNAAAEGRSKSILRDAIADNKLFVPTRDFVGARKLLDERHVLVLTGEPGIGKTTVAQRLLFELVAKGFEPVVIADDVSEAEACFREGERQVFYFDDFVGRTYLEVLRAKKDSHLLGLMKRVSAEKHKRFILTSRVSVLNRAAFQSDLVAAALATKGTFELEVKNLAKLDRGKILYNHLWHSAIPVEFKEVLLANLRYRRVVLHSQFNPRVVSFVLDSSRLGNLEVGKFWKFIEYRLDHPSAVWEHYFSSQLSPECKDLALLVTLSGGALSELELKRAFQDLNGGSMTPAELSATYARAAREATGSVLTKAVDDAEDDTRYRLLNPSIEDYVHADLRASEQWPAYFAALRIARALDQFEQLRSAKQLGESTARECVERLVATEATRELVADAYGLQLGTIAAEFRSAACDRLCNRLLLAADKWELGSGLKHAVKFVSQMRRRQPGAATESASRHLVEHSCEYGAPVNDRETMRLLWMCAEEVGLGELSERLRKAGLDRLQGSLERMVAEDGMFADEVDDERLSSMEDKLMDFVSTRLEQLGVDASSDEIERLCGYVDLPAILESNRGAAQGEDDAFDDWRDAQREHEDELRELDDLFSGLDVPPKHS